MRSTPPTRRALLPLEDARAKRLSDSSSTTCPSRRSPARRCVEPKLSTLREYIDWTFFFTAWELKGKFPAILDSPSHGAVGARAVRARQRAARRDRSRRSWLQAQGVYGFWPARAEGDDIVLRECGVRFPMLRQQVDHGDDKPYLSLADFVAPRRADHVGAFAVTAGSASTSWPARFEAEHDDYRAIMVKALADRLAEAFAEYLHEVARREWYETGPKLSRRRSDRARSTAASARRSATRPAPTTRRSTSSSTCSARDRSAWTSPSRAR